VKQPLICEAIREGRAVSFLYGPDSGRFRTVVPLGYGLGRKGYELMRGFQVAGWSASRTLPAWRLFIVAKMRSLSVTQIPAGAIVPARSPHPDPAMVEVYCQAGMG
jgi:hypothetical protein